jgi:iron complex transport system substrate-binding protein
MVHRKHAGVPTLALALALALVAAVHASAARTGFPTTVAAANGKVTLAQKPVRIVSLSPSATEDLYAIGAGPQVVAVDDQSNYPKAAPRTKLSGYTPNVEAIAAYRPDLVVVSNDTHGVVKALGKLRIPVLLEPAAANLAGAYAQIRQLGIATGRTAAADRLVAKLKARVRATLAGLPRPAAKLSVYHELGPDYYSVTSRTFIGQIYTLLGLRNIADKADKAGSGYPKLSGEYILAANPDLVVLSDTICCSQTAATVKARPGWAGLAAAKSGGIVGVSDDVASRWGPRIVSFMQAVAAGMRSVAGR